MCGPSLKGGSDRDMLGVNGLLKNRGLVGCGLKQPIKSELDDFFPEVGLNINKMFESTHLVVFAFGWFFTGIYI